MSIKVGIDISSLIYGRGVSRYTANLVRALLDYTAVDLVLYGSSFRQNSRLKKLADSVKTANPTIPTIIQSYPPKMLALLWRLGRNSIRSNIAKIDVFHSWDWLQPPDKNLPLVSTIHDLAILKYPETAHPEVVRKHRRAWQVLKDRQAHIIAVSQATKQDIVKLLDIPASRVHVVYEALPLETIQAAELLTDHYYQQIKDRLRLDKPYIFFVGTREPRKNLDRLIKAWQPLADKYDLIIAGAAGWDQTDQKPSASTKPQPRFLGRVPDRDLVVLYGEAELFAYPSLYEGFGLPILEAFYHGTPVITSDTSSMPEVAGNAAELVDPESIKSIRQGMEKVLKENKTAQKQRLQKMILRLQLFDWRRVAEQTLAVYQKAKMEPSA
jgi:glycosyltransferase involved in cell wall biosynthesis